jgi:hypothetical protein
MEWRDFEAAASDLAEGARGAFQRHRIGMLATVRRDGSPRISTVEPYFIGGRLVLGLLPWSAKARDLDRDPRCELHNPVTDVEGADPEIRLRARAVPIDRADLAGADAGAWWTNQPAEKFTLVSLDIVAADSVTWDVAGDRLSIERWTPSGTVRRSRSYP